MSGAGETARSVLCRKALAVIDRWIAEGETTRPRATWADLIDRATMAQLRAFCGEEATP